MASPAAILSIVINANTSQATGALAKTNAQLRQTAASADKTSGVIGGRLTKAAKLGGVALSAGLAYGLVKSVTAGASFEKQMDSVGAVADASRKQMKRLEKQALRLGQQTAFSAGEVADAQGELVKGGLKVRDILGGALPAALSLAAAGELGLADASATTVNAMKLFELRAGQAGQVADMLATAANTTTADVADFAMALKQGGSAAKAAGLDLNDTVTILEALAEAGIKNSDAGTSMKTAMLQLIAPTDRQAALAQQLGLNFLTANGELKDAAGISAELRDALGGMSKSQQAANLKVLAGTDGFRTLAALYDAGPKKLEKLSKANEKHGTAQKIAQKKQDNLAGSVEQLGGAFETLGIKLSKKLNPAIRAAVDWLTEAVTNIANFDFTPIVDRTVAIAKGVAQVSENVAGAVATGFRAVVSGVTSAIDAIASAVQWIGQAASNVVGFIQSLIPVKIAIFQIKLVLAPVVLTFKALWGVLKDLSPLLGFVGRTIKTVVVRAFKIARSIVSAFVRNVVNLGRVVGDVVGVISNLLRGDFAGAWRNAKQLVGSVARFFVDVFRGAWDSMKSLFTNSIGGVKDIVVDGFKAIGKTAARIFKSAFGSVVNVVKGAFDRILGVVSSALGVLADIADELDGVPVIGDKIAGLGDAARGAQTDIDGFRETLRGTKDDDKRVSFKRLLRGLTDVRKGVDATDRQWDRYYNTLDRNLKNANNSGSRHAKHVSGDQTVIGAALDKGRKNADRYSDGVSKDFGKVTQRSGKTAVGVGKNIGILGRVVTAGLELIGGNTNKALEAFNVKPVKFSLAKATGKALGMIFGQRGGPISEGKPSGDSVPAMLERGEYVLNRQAVKAMGKERLDAINFGAAPRFQKGGYAGVSGDTDFKPALGFALSKMARSTGRSIFVTSGGRTMAEQAALYQAYLNGTGNLAAAPSPNAPHVSGRAADISPGRGVFGGVAGKFGLGFTVPSEDWHIELLNAVAGARGGGSPKLAKLARVLLSGPDGPLKRMGQGALDKAHRAAQGFLNRKAGSGGFGGGASGPWASVLRKIARARGWSVSDWMALVQGESGGNPAAVNPSSGAFGLGQFLGSTKAAYAKYGATSSNGADQIRAMAKYIADRYGNPTAAYHAWLSRSPHWYQQGGLVGFAKGGHVGKMRSGLDADLSPVRKLSDRLKRLKRRIARIDERIEIAETTAGLDSSERGSDLGPSEQAKQIRLNRNLAKQLRRQARFSAHGVKLSNRLMDKAGGSQKGKLRDMRSTFREALVDAQGVTGKGGRLFDTATKLDTLRHTSTSAFDSLDLGGLRDVLELARFGGFDGLPKFHQGGVVPGPRGIERPIMATGGETILPPGSGGLQISNEISIDIDAMEALVDTSIDGKLAKHERIRIKSSRQVGV